MLRGEGGTEQAVETVRQKQVPFRVLHPRECIALLGTEERTPGGSGPLSPLERQGQVRVAWKGASGLLTSPNPSEDSGFCEERRSKSALWGIYLLPF